MTEGGESEAARQAAIQAILNGDLPTRDKIIELDKLGVSGFDSSQMIRDAKERKRTEDYELNKGNLGLT
jgi:hypothetical protein